MKKPIPIVVVAVASDGFQTFRLDGETQMAFIEELADQLDLADGQRAWMHRCLDFKAVYADENDRDMAEIVEDIRTHLDGFPDWQNRIPSGLAGRLRALLGQV